MASETCAVTLLALLVVGLSPPGAFAQDPPPPPSSRISDSVKNRQTITSDAEVTSRVDNEPIDPTGKGFISIPGTSTRLKIGGYIRLDLIHDFAVIGSPDDFIVSSIPVDVTSGADNTQIHARQTRFNLDVRRPGAHGDLRAVFENDFFGPAGERAFNLRHAYGQYRNVLGGFTASTLADSDARPDTLDHEGPPARVSVRHAQARYTLKAGGKHSIAFAIEEPKSDIPGNVADENVTARTPWPDIVARYRFDSRRGHLQAGSLYRSIGGFLGTGTAEDQVLGIGLVVSGSRVIGARDTLVFEAALGKGIARYVKDTSGLGLDAALEEGRLRAVPLRAALAGYEHAWSDRWRSTIAASVLDIETLASQPADTYHFSRYLTTNLMFNPGTSLTFGVEVDWGQLTVKDGRDNSDTRLQVAVQYDLVR